MDNPFFYGRTVSGNAFVDRKREINEIAAHARRGQNVILHSPRRFGKTSLIFKVRNALEQKGVVVFYLDLYRIASLEQFVNAFSQTVIAKIQSPAKKLLALVQSLLPSLRPRLVYEDPSSPTIELEIGLEAFSKKETLQEIFNAVETHMTSRKKRGCVVFDEFQEITFIEGGEKLEREMRSAFQHHQRVSYIFLGSRHHLMEGIFKDKTRPFYNFGLHYALGAIEEKDWISHISQQFSKGGFTLPDDMANQIARLTEGHPYYTQLFCSALWERYKDKKTIQRSSLEEIQKLILEREDHAFSEIWDGFNSRQRTLLSALAREQRAQLFSKRFLKKYGFYTAATIQRATQTLLKKDVITRDGEGYYTVTDPVFALWLRHSGR